MRKLGMFFVYALAIWGAGMLGYLIYCIPIYGFHGEVYDISDGYSFVNHGLVKWGFCHSSGRTLVPPDVLMYHDDDSIMLLHSVPDEKFIDTTDVFLPDEKKINKTMLDIHDCYWILIKKNDSVIGPLTYKEFICKCDSMGVNSSMKTW